MISRGIDRWLSVVCILMLAHSAQGQEALSATVVKVSGDVRVEKADGQIVPASVEMALAAGDIIRTGAGAAVTLKLGDGNTLCLQENSHLRIGAPKEGASETHPKPPPTLNLLNGSLLGRLKNVPKGSKVSIGTATSLAGIEGTTFAVTTSGDEGRSSVAVLEGTIAVESRGDRDRSVVVGARQMTWVSEWSKTVLTATGSGVASGRYRPIKVQRNNVEITVVRGSGSGRTQQEAVKNALQELSGRILRAKVGPDMSVAEWLVGKDDAYARLSAFVSGAAILPKGVQPDGTIEVDAEVNLPDLDRVLEQKVPVFEGAVVPVDDIKYSMNFGPRERLTAERAATLDAQRKLLEMIQGVCITSQTTVKDFAMQSDVIRARVEGVLRGAETVSTRYFSDGTVEVTMCIRGPALVTEINRAAQKDVMGRNYLSKPNTLDLPTYAHLRAFDSEE